MDGCVDTFTGAAVICMGLRLLACSLISSFWGMQIGGESFRFPQGRRRGSRSFRTERGEESMHCLD
jgi:hypothetical protein